MPGAGQTMPGHSHKGLQGVWPLLSKLQYLLVPQKRLAWAQHAHDLVKRINDYFPMTYLHVLFLQETRTNSHQPKLSNRLLVLRVALHVHICLHEHADIATHVC